MAVKFQGVRKISNRHNTLFLRHEMVLLMQNYDFVKCKIVDGVLFCDGKYSQTGVEYTYRVRYDGTIPEVRILSPQVQHKMHIYSDGTLCLYYPKEMKWTSKLHLYDTIIPWTHEWILYYEIYKQTGQWEHPDVVHENGEEKIRDFV